MLYVCHVTKTMVGSHSCNVIVGKLTCCSLLHSVCDLKTSTDEHAMESNLEMLYKFELSHNTAETTKNICCVKGEDSLSQ